MVHIGMQRLLHAAALKLSIPGCVPSGCCADLNYSDDGALFGKKGVIGNGRVCPSFGFDTLHDLRKNSGHPEEKLQSNESASSLPSGDPHEVNIIHTFQNSGPFLFSFPNRLSGSIVCRTESC